MKDRLELKLDQIEFIDNCIINLKHLERCTTKLNDSWENPLLNDILKTLNWLYTQQERITDEINNLKGYGSYTPQNN